MRNIMDSQNQRGLSIIELMVALLLSSLLILGITQIYLDNKRGYLFQQGQTELSDSARYSLMFLDNELHKAGFRRRPDVGFDQVFGAHPANGLQAGNVSAKIDNGIILRYQAAHPEQISCDGDAIPDTPTTPYVGIDASPLISTIEFKDGELQCNGQTIVDGIADFNLSYAVGSRLDSARKIEHYTDDPQAGDEIRGIKYEILFETESKNLTDTFASKVYSDWRKRYYNQNDASPANKSIYQVAGNTIIFRNVTP